MHSSGGAHEALQLAHRPWRGPVHLEEADWVAVHGLQQATLPLVEERTLELPGDTLVVQALLFTKGLRAQRLALGLLELCHAAHLLQGGTCRHSVREASLTLIPHIHKGRRKTFMRWNTFFFPSGLACGVAAADAHDDDDDDKVEGGVEALLRVGR